MACRAALLINGNGTNRVLYVPAGLTVALKGLTITNGGAGSGFGGGILNYGAVILSQCTLSGNSAAQGGAIENSGNCFMTNCTVTLNKSQGNGAGIDDNLGSLTLTHCTVVSNTATGGGGGVANFQRTLTLLNSIVAGNSGAIGQDIDNFAQSTVINLGTNIEQNVFNDSGSTNLGTVPINAAPLLAALGNYGGPTPTMPPLLGSPAIDAALATALTTDQRGDQRPVGPAPDIGAVEYETSPVITTTNDSGAGSLRYAVTYSPNGAALSFAPALSNQPIVLTSGEITLNQNVTLDASGLANGATVSGNSNSPIFLVNYGVNVVLKSLTISNGFSSRRLRWCHQFPG